MEIRTGHGGNTLNFRLVSVLLILLLLGITGFGIWQYSEKQRLQTERDQLRSQLDETAAKLREAQEEQDTLRAELNQTRTRVSQLEGKITQLEANMTALQNELKNIREDLQMRTGAITVGLSFFWLPSLKLTFEQFTAKGEMASTMHELNKIWDETNVYFFVYKNEVWDISDDKAAQVQSSLPKACPSWAYQAAQKYPNAKDIPLIMVPWLPSNYGGCACWSVRGGAVGDPIILKMSMPRYLYIPMTHELIHIILGVDDLELPTVFDGIMRVIFPSAQSRLHRAALKFQMSPPDGFS